LTFPRTIVLIANTASVNKAPIVELKEEVFRAYESESRSHHIKRTQAEAEKLQIQEASRASINSFKIRQLVCERCAFDWG
jgi:hypothetical protein